MADARACPLCGGGLSEGTTTFAADFGAGVVVVRHVPATRCDQCGEAWISDAQAAEIETLVHKARATGNPVEVIDLAA